MTQGWLQTYGPFLDGHLFRRNKLSEGKKYDQDKSPFVQGCLRYFPHALEAVAMVSAYGLKKYNLKYEDRNWAKVSDGHNRYTDALGRHLLEVDGRVDKESGLMHEAMAAWNALARLELTLTEDKNETTGM